MIAAGALAWCAGAVALALYLGRVLRVADMQAELPTDDDLMALVQAENLSPADVDREIARMEAWL